jgi:hypothetical protein
VHGSTDFRRRLLSVLVHRYFPELLPELEAEALVLELLPVPPAPAFDVGLPKMVWPDVFLLGAKTELKSCPIPCMVLQPVIVTHPPAMANTSSRENIVVSFVAINNPPDCLHAQRPCLKL